MKNIELWLNLFSTITTAIGVGFAIYQVNSWKNQKKLELVLDLQEIFDSYFNIREQIHRAELEIYRKNNFESFDLYDEHLNVLLDKKAEKYREYSIKYKRVKIFHPIFVDIDIQYLQPDKIEKFFTRMGEGIPEAGLNHLKEWGFWTNEIENYYRKVDEIFNTAIGLLN